MHYEFGPQPKQFVSPRIIRFVLILGVISTVTFFLFWSFTTVGFPLPTTPYPDILATRYKFKQNVHKYSPTSTEYKLAIITDLDKDSKVTGEQTWQSILHKGVLTRNPTNGQYSVKWGEETVLRSKINEAGRAMELSELTYYDNKLLTFDDRTGIVFQLINSKAIPYHILMDKNGIDDKGMKIEWSSVKDNLLYIGSTGKEWTTPEGEFVNNNPQWVKTLDIEGRVKYEDWGHVYSALRKATKTEYPGYLLHEAVRWNDMNRRWYFLPRRVSREKYNDQDDEKRGSNLMLSMDETFSDIQIKEIGPLVPTHGFSTFQFIPWREHELVALKTEEYQGKTATYITVLDLEGKVLMAEELITDRKYEGLEII